MINRRTWIMLGLLVVAVVAAVWWSRSGAGVGGEATGTPGPEPLWRLSPDQVSAIGVTSGDGEAAFSAQRDPEAGWLLLQPEPGDSQLMVGRVERAVTSLLAPQPVDVLRDATLEQFGLSPPMYEVVLQLQDGSTRELWVGRQAPTGDVAYVARPDESTVYFLQSFAVQEVIALIEQPPLVTPTPGPSEPEASAEVE